MIACIIVGCVRLPIWPAEATGELGPQSDACSDRGFLGGRATLEVIFPRSRLEWSDLCPPQHPPSTSTSSAFSYTVHYITSPRTTYTYKAVSRLPAQSLLTLRSIVIAFAPVAAVTTQAPTRH